MISEIRYEPDADEATHETRRQKARVALDALDRLFISPRNSRARSHMRPWHYGVYLSYSNMAVDIYGWKPMEWQVETLEGMVALYSMVTVTMQDGSERITL